MNLTEHAAAKPSPKTGIYATLRAFLHLRGTGTSSASAPRALVRSLTTLWVVLAALVFSAAPAFAAQVFPRLGKIAGPAPGSSFVHLDPGSVAADDANHHILVADSGVGLVYDFTSSSDTHPTVWDGANTPAGSFGEFGAGLISVAVDNASGDVYVADTKHLVIDKFDASGKLISSFGDTSPTPNGQLAGLKTPAGSFSHPSVSTPVGIAVDQATHALYVIDSHHKVIDVFSPEGAYEKQITATPVGLYDESGFEFTDGIAVNATTGHVFVSNTGSGAAFELDSLGAPVDTWTGAGAPSSFGGYVSVAVSDMSGDFYVTNTYPEGVVDQFTSTGGYLGQITGTPGGGDGGVAVDQATGELYVSDNASASVVRIFGATAVTLPTPTTNPATEVHPRSATLNGTVDPEGIKLTECRFDYVNAAAYEPEAFNPYSAGGTVPCVPSAAEIPVDSEKHVVQADVSGLQPGATYHFRLVASNANGAEFAQDSEFSTLPPPAITGASVSNLTATSVDLNAQVNPNGVAVESCVFEYGTEAGVYPHQVACTPPAAQIGSATTPVTVIAHLENLEANKTEYHYRLVATSAAGATTSLDHTFAYPEIGGGLPDHRSYEMVTPPQKNGTLLGNFIFAFPSDFADDGSRVVLGTLDCFANAESCVSVRGKTGSIYSFTRTSAGWSPKSLGPSATQFRLNTRFLANPDSGAALFSAPTPPTGQDDFYVRQPGGSFDDVGPVSPPSGGPSLSVLQNAGNVAASADLSHVVYGTEPIWPGSGREKTLFEYAQAGSSEPAFVGVSGGSGSKDLISECGTGLGSEAGPGESRGGLSDDGRIVYFTASPCEKGKVADAGIPVPVSELYARVDNGEAGAHTVAISEPRAPQLVAGGPPEPQLNCTGETCQQNTCASVTCQKRWREAQFQGTSIDGSEAIFTSSQQLTDTATEDANPGGRCNETSGSNGCNLYLHDSGSPSGRQLIDASAGEQPVVGGPRVQGVLAFSSDGSHVYFVAKGVLTGVANNRGQIARDGAENLYVFEHESGSVAGHLTFITTLPFDINLQQELGGEPLGRQANVTPDGRFLVFMSSGALTPDATRTDGAQQVFRYDAGSSSHPPTLARISIGEHGFNDNGNAGAGDAYIVPAWKGYDRPGAGRPDPTMSNDGEYVFFMSPVALIPGALESVPLPVAAGKPQYAENVYEYHAGTVSLISDGHDTSTGAFYECEPYTSSVCLLGADTSGANVFFSTADRLLPQDTDTQLDFYDARTCTDESPCIAPPAPAQPPCQGEACHGTPPATPGEPSGGSATLNGAGNLTPAAVLKKKTVKCAKGKKLSRKKCVKKRKSRNRKGNARKTRNNRRAGR